LISRLEALLLTVAAVPVLATGCSDTPRSCDVDNASLIMSATVSDLDSGVEVEIELETGSNGSGTALALCPDDQLFVNGVETEELRALGHLYYTVDFDEPDPSYEITLARKDHDDVSVLVEMPPSFEITAPAENAELSRAAPWEITWAPGWADQTIELDVADEIGSTCIEGLGLELVVDDTGSYGVAGNTLKGQGGSCEVTISLTRVIEGEYPSQLAPGGSVTALVKRRRPIVTVE
jgi:hypothetical protein